MAIRPIDVGFMSLSQETLVKQVNQCLENSFDGKLAYVIFRSILPTYWTLDEKIHVEIRDWILSHAKSWKMCGIDRERIVLSAGSHIFESDSVKSPTEILKLLVTPSQAEIVAALSALIREQFNGQTLYIDTKRGENLWCALCGCLQAHQINMESVDKLLQDALQEFDKKGWKTGHSYIRLPGFGP